MPKTAGRPPKRQITMIEKRGSELAQHIREHTNIFGDGQDVPIKDADYVQMTVKLDGDTVINVITGEPISPDETYRILGFEDPITSWEELPDWEDYEPTETAKG